MKTQTIYLNVPASDMPFFRKLAKNMGWTIASDKKLSGIDKGLKDLNEGRSYTAKDTAELFNQILG